MITLDKIVNGIIKLPIFKDKIAQQRLAELGNAEIAKRIESATYYNLNYFNNWQQAYYDPNPIHKNPKFEGIAVFYTMGTDSKLASSTNQRMDTLINKPWYMRPAIENDETELIKAGFAKQVLLHIRSLNQKKRGILSDMVYGNSFAEKVLGFRDIEFTINVKISKKKRESRRIKIPNACVIEDIVGIPPTAFSFDAKRRMYYGTAAGDIRPVTPQERYNLIFSVFDDKFGSPYGWPLYTSVFSHWIMKKAIQQWRLVYLEKHAIGTTLGRYPKGYNKDSPEVKDLNLALDNLMWSAKVVTPEGFEISTINDASKTATMDLFQNCINYIDQCFSELILGHKQATEATSVGSLASSTVKEAALRQAILETDAMRLDTVMDEQVVEQIIDLNFPYNGLYPAHTTHVEVEKDLEERRETFKMALDSGMELSETQMRRELHVDAPIDEFDVVSPEDNVKILQYQGVKNNALTGKTNGNGNGTAKFSRSQRRKLTRQLMKSLKNSKDLEEFEM